MHYFTTFQTDGIYLFISVWGRPRINIAFHAHTEGVYRSPLEVDQSRVK